MRLNLFIVLLMALFIIINTKPSHAASVYCSFDAGERYNLTSGAWIGEIDIDSLWDLFPEGLELPLEDSLFRKLDTEEIFKAGSESRGTLYLKGASGYIDGRLTSIASGKITVYRGSCDVSWGG